MAISLPWVHRTRKRDEMTFHQLEDNPMKATYFQQKSVTTQDSRRVLYGFVEIYRGHAKHPLPPLPCCPVHKERLSQLLTEPLHSYMTSEALTYWSQIFLTDSELMGQPTQIRTKKWERGVGSVASISQQRLMWDDIRCSRCVAHFSPFKTRGHTLKGAYLGK